MTKIHDRDIEARSAVKPQNYWLNPENLQTGLSEVVDDLKLLEEVMEGSPDN